MTVKQHGTVTLVGAGCGKGLITIRGLNALKSADVLLYDDLIDEGLLLFVKECCKCVYVGKRYRQHSRKQEEIQDLMIQYALSGKNVVRLKGGDSFVFGRGGEEILALQNAGISYDVIPGVTSSVAVPEELGIPVTHRKTARSFTVITGHTADGTGANFKALAESEGTLVFLMGLHAAGEIAHRLMKYGKDPDTPAAVLSNGFTPEEKRYDCTLRTLEDTASKAKSPAILVVGEAASMHLESASEKPLKYVSVAVTGTGHFISAMRKDLEALGADEVPCPCLSIHARPEKIPDQFLNYHWIAFTSANGVRIFFEELKRKNIDIRKLYRQKFAVIGRGTAAELKKYGILADFIPDRFISDVFGKELAEKILQDRTDLNQQNTSIDASAEELLILRAENGSPALTEELGSAGVSYKDVKIYETGSGKAESSAMEDILKSCSYITFSSGAGVRAFFQEYTLPEQAVPVCIGPSTAKVFQSYSPKTFLMPEEYTVHGMAEEILHHYLRSKQPVSCRLRR